LASVIRGGITDKGMPKFEGTLSEDAIFAIAQYIKSLPAVAAPATAAVIRRQLTGPEKEGRAVFFDATRMGSCGVCHEADTWGAPVVEIAQVPADAAALRAFQSSRVRTYSAGAETFAGLPVSDDVVYDLNSPLPVRRRLKAASAPVAWRHDLERYNDAELSAVLRFLRAVRK
jgi:cytochrome c553